eukprot:Sspe_Gene.85910::Locus_56663_Transcript_4_5_Confidence_0.250_Length_1176::g.85910::m.85910
MAGAMRPTSSCLGQAHRLSNRNSGKGRKRPSWLQDYLATPGRPVMWRVYMRDDQFTRKQEELFQNWRGIVDFAYRRPYGQVKHPAWMRRLMAQKKEFELEAETATERIYLGFTAHYIWAHWSRRGAVIPPVQVLDLALREVSTVKDLGYATKMLRSYRQYFNVHLEHDTFSNYVDACLRVGCPDCALYALNQARWLGFATVKQADHDFLQGEVETLREWEYQKHVAEPLKKLEENGNPHEEGTAEVKDFSPFAKFWASHSKEQGYWVMPWEKDPTMKVLHHFWRHPKNIDPRHGTAYTEWTEYGTPLPVNDYGEPVDPIGEEAIAGLQDPDEEEELGKE